MTGHDLTLHRTSFTRWMPDRLRGAPPAQPRGLVVVSGQVTERALRAWMARNGIPTGALAITTIERLSRDLCSAANLTARSMDRAWLHAAVDRYLDTVDWNEASDAVVPRLLEYLRATDSGARADHDRLLEHAARLADDGYPFDATIAEREIERLRTLTDHVESLVTDRYPTRTHLSTASRSAVDAWPSIYPTVEWIAVATISRLDNPTMRLVCELARDDGVPSVDFFAGIGTADRLDDRFEQAAARSGFTYDAPAPADDLGPLERAATGDRVSLADGDVPLDVRTVTVPDTRREAAHVLQHALSLESEGGSAGDVLAIAPDAGDYRVDADDLARRFNVPVDVETRFPLVHQPVVRALRSTLSLLGAPSDEPLPLDDVLRPLRLGLLPAGDDWSDPVPDAALSRLRRDLRDAGMTDPRSVDEWLDVLAATDERVESFVTQLRDARTQPPNADTLAWLASLVDAYPAAVSTRLDVGAGPTFGTADGCRHAVHDDPRPTDQTRSEIRAALRMAADLRADLVDGAAARAASQRWATFADLFVETIAGSGGGRSINDNDAARFVDAGNAYFRRAPHVIVAGLAETVFPTGNDLDDAFPTSLRTAVSRSADPFLHLDTKEAAVDRSRDRYGAALRCAEERLTLLRPARDGDDRELSPSRFIRGLSLPDDRRLRFSAATHPVDGLVEDPGRPRWLDRTPETRGSRLRAVALHAGPSGSTDSDARLAEIAATLPDGVAERVTRTAADMGEIVAAFEDRREDWDADAAIDFPADLDLQTGAERDRSRMDPEEADD